VSSLRASLLARLHAERWLAAYAEDQLPLPRRERVAAHLVRCGRCADRLAAIEEGLAAARGLVNVAPPSELDRRVLAAFAARPARRGGEAVQRRRTTARFVLAGSATVLLVVLAVVSRRGVEVIPSPGPPGRLESLALASHRRLADGALDLQVKGDSPAAVRVWLRRRELAAALAERRPAEDAGRFRLLGAVDVSRPGMRAAAVHYHVDGAALTLLVARQDEAPDAPRWGRFGKRVHHRSENGTDLLTWTNSGKAYTLAAEGGARVQRGCLLCHAGGPLAAQASRLALPTAPHG
jgi:anti-sigma factor RsiW